MTEVQPADVLRRVVLPSFDSLAGFNGESHATLVAYTAFIVASGLADDPRTAEEVKARAVVLTNRGVWRPAATAGAGDGSGEGEGEAAAAEATAEASPLPPTVPAGTVVYIPKALGNTVDLQSEFPQADWTFVSPAYAGAGRVPPAKWLAFFSALGAHAFLPVVSVRRELMPQQWRASPWPARLQAGCAVTSVSCASGDAAVDATPPVAAPGGAKGELLGLSFGEGAGEGTVAVVEDYESPEFAALVAQLQAKAAGRELLLRLDALARLVEFQWAATFRPALTATCFAAPVRAAGEPGALPAVVDAPRRCASTLLTCLRELEWLPCEQGEAAAVDVPTRLHVASARSRAVFGDHVPYLISQLRNSDMLQVRHPLHVLVLGALFALYFEC